MFGLIKKSKYDKVVRDFNDVKRNYTKASQELSKECTKYNRLSRTLGDANATINQLRVENKKLQLEVDRLNEVISVASSCCEAEQIIATTNVVEEAKEDKATTKATTKPNRGGKRSKR